MSTLVWFVQEALNHSGILHFEWETMSRQKQIEVLTKWQTECEVKFDVVATARFKKDEPASSVLTTDVYDTVALSHRTAEYASVLIGQTRWGNTERRRQASKELGEIKLINASDCFSKITEDQCPQCGKRM